MLRRTNKFAGLLARGAAISFFTVEQCKRNPTYAQCNANQPSGAKVPLPLLNIIPTVKEHPLQHIALERCDEWISVCTKDFQTLVYGPKDFVVMIAFLRLLGVDQISLTEISQNIASRKSFLNKLHPLTTTSEPLLTHSVEEAFSSIIEFNIPPNQVKIKSLYSEVRSPITHVLPSVIKESQQAFQEGKIDQLYTIVANLTDHEIEQFSEQFDPNACVPNKLILINNLAKARTICTEYFSYNNSPK